jgi:hypothetical protein
LIPDQQRSGGRFLATKTELTDRGLGWRNSSDLSPTIPSMSETCAHCDENFTDSDDTIECELHDGRIEHIDCHSYRGCESELITMPDRALLALHTKECIEVAMGDAPGSFDDEAAFVWVSQLIDHGTYTCNCPDANLTK